MQTTHLIQLQNHSHDNNKQISLFLIRRYAFKGVFIASNQGMILDKLEPCYLVRKSDNVRYFKVIEVHDEDNLRCGFITQADNRILEDMMDRWNKKQLLLEANFVTIYPVTEYNMQADIKSETLIQIATAYNNRHSKKIFI